MLAVFWITLYDWVVVVVVEEEEDWDRDGGCESQLLAPWIVQAGWIGKPPPPPLCALEAGSEADGRVVWMIHPILLTGGRRGWALRLR